MKPPRRGGRRGAAYEHETEARFAAIEQQFKLQNARLELVEAAYARLRGALGVPDAPAIYTSRRQCGPAGVSDERWKEIAKKIGHRPPGARWYVVPRAAYEQWLNGQAAPVSGVPASAPVPTSAASLNAANDATAPKWHPSQTLEHVGRRLVGGRP